MDFHVGIRTIYYTCKGHVSRVERKQQLKEQNVLVLLIIFRLSYVNFLGWLKLFFVFALPQFQKS
jgi:hypothetical protein